MKLETEFLRFGITLAQWDVLCSIRQNPGASGAEIARDCLVTPQTVSLVLPRLEQMSLITRQKAERGRVIQTWITKTGENALEQCNLHIAAVERLLTSAIGVEQAEKLADSLKLCVIALAGRPDPKVAAM